MTSWIKHPDATAMSQETLNDPYGLAGADDLNTSARRATVAAISARVCESLRVVSEMLDAISRDLADVYLPDTNLHLGFAADAINDALRSLDPQAPADETEPPNEYPNIA